MAVLNRLLRSTTSPRQSHILLGVAPSQQPSSPIRRKLDPRDLNVQWVFLRCPVVGRETYASRLSKLLGVPHIATGDLVREELSSSKALASTLAEIVNQGKPVSDELIIKLLSKRLELGEATGESGFILDGFPRTINQAEILDEVTDIDLVVNLKLGEATSALELFRPDPVQSEPTSASRVAFLHTLKASVSLDLHRP
uniref:adenylate kinase n=1 Tax=Kalanchoe fedtschenkoi TaxID=63787 RepID=A0A7N0U8D3_KALFE